MRKPAFFICENKDADQLLAIFYGYTAWFMSDLVGNPEDRFSHNEDQLRSLSGCLNLYYTTQVANIKSAGQTVQMQRPIWAFVV